MFRKALRGFLEDEATAEAESEYKALQGFNPLAKTRSEREAHYQASDRMREALVGEAVKLYADAIGKQIEAAALVIEMGGSESAQFNTDRLLSGSHLSRK